LTSICGQNFQKSFFSTQERMTGIFTIIHFFLFFLTLGIFKKDTEWLSIFKTSAVCSFLASLLALYQKINPSFLGPMPDAEIYGPAGNSITLSIYLIFNIFLLLFILLKEDNKRDKKWWIAILATNLIAFFFTGSASAYIGLFLGLCVFLFLKIRGYKVFQKNKFLTIVIIFLIIFAAIYGAITLSSKTGSFFERFNAWKMGINAFLERPLSGYGWENFNLIYNKFYDPRSFTSTTPDFHNAHNNFVDFLSLSGILGFLSYILLVFLFFTAAKKSKNPEIFIGLTIAYVLTIFFNFDTFLSWLMFFLVLGYLTSKEGLEKKINPGPAIKYAIFSIFAIATIFSLNINIQSALANFYATKSIRSTTPESVIENFKKSENFKNYDKVSLRSTLSNFLATISKENTPIDSKKIYEFLEPLLKSNLEKNKENQNNYLTLGVFYRNFGEIEKTKLEKASQVFQEAIENNPRKQGFYFLEAQTKILQKKNNEAVSFAEEGVKLYENSPQAHLFLAIAHLFNNDEASFKAEIKIFDKLNGDSKKITPKRLLNGKSYTTEYYIDIFNVYLKTGEKQKIISLAKEISKIEMDPYLHQYIAGLYLEFGEKELAKEENEWIKTNYPELDRSTANFKELLN
jgi:O-antigen ligase